MITIAHMHHRAILFQSAIKINAVRVLFSARRNDHVDWHVLQLVPVHVRDELLNGLTQDY